MRFCLVTRKGQFFFRETSFCQTRLTCIYMIGTMSEQPKASDIVRRRSRSVSDNTTPDVKITLNDSVFCDDVRKVPANETSLRLHSLVFEQMLVGPLAHSGRRIHIYDVNIKYDALKFVIRNIYYEDIRVPTTADMAERTKKFDAQLGHRYRKTIAGQLTDDVIAGKCLYASRVYLLDGMKSVCETYLAQNRRIENTSRILSLAYSLDIPHLRDLCVEYMSEESEEVLCSHSILDISRGAFHYLLGRGDFLADEVMIYHAATRWAVKSRNSIAPDELKAVVPEIRSELKSCLYNIRFPLMPREFLDSHIRPSNILTPEELQNMDALFVNENRIVVMSFNPAANIPNITHLNVQFIIVFSCSIDIKLHCLKVKDLDESVVAIETMTNKSENNFGSNQFLKIGKDWYIDGNQNIIFTKPVLLKRHTNCVIIKTDPCMMDMCRSGTTTRKIRGVKVTATYFTDNFISADLSPAYYNPATSSDESSEGSLSSSSLSPQLSLNG